MENITGVLYYRGCFNDLSQIADPKIGDVVSCNNDEYIYTGDKWEEIGVYSEPEAPSRSVNRPIKTNCPRCGAPLGILSEKEISTGVTTCKFCDCSISIWDFDYKEVSVC